MGKCVKCNKTVTKKNPGVQCTKCSKWYHASCASLSTDQLSALSKIDSIDWKCRECQLVVGGKNRRLSIILPDVDEEESDVERGTHRQDEKTLFAIHQEIRELRQTVRNIIRDELQTTLQFYSNKIDEYEEKTKTQEKRIKLIENQCLDMANKCKNMALKTEILEQKLSKLEQSLSSNDMEICGIPEQQNEDVKQVAISVCQLIKQSPEDIIKVVRKKKPNRPGSAQSERAKIDAPITISLREGKREIWSEAARSIKITAKDVIGEGNTKVYIRDSLTPTTSYLLWKTKTTLKENELCKYVWCKNGQIMVRKKDGDNKIYYVRSENDIDRIYKELMRKAQG